MQNISSKIAQSYYANLQYKIFKPTKIKGNIFKYTVCQKILAEISFKICNNLHPIFKTSYIKAFEIRVFGSLRVKILMSQCTFLLDQGSISSTIFAEGRS